MNNYLKLALLGFVMWLIPFVTSIAVWDVETNAPIISQEWFSSLMAFTFAIGLAIGLYFYFKKIKKDSVKHGWIAGIFWFIQLALLDAIFLLGVFSVSLADYFPVLLAYLIAPIITVTVGHLKK